MNASWKNESRYSGVRVLIQLVEHIQVFSGEEPKNLFTHYMFYNYKKTLPSICFWLFSVSVVLKCS